MKGPETRVGISRNINRITFSRIIGDTLLSDVVGLKSSPTRHAKLTCQDAWLRYAGGIPLVLTSVLVLHFHAACSDDARGN